MPEVHEAGVVERRGGLEARDVAAELGGFLVRLAARWRAAFQRMAERMRCSMSRSPGMGRLPLDRDRVEIGRRSPNTGPARPGAVHLPPPVRGESEGVPARRPPARLRPIEPFPGLERITVAGLVQGSLPMRDASKMWIAVGGKRTQPAPLQAPAQRAGAAASRAPPIPNEPIRGAPEDVSVT